MPPPPLAAQPDVESPDRLRAHPRTDVAPTLVQGQMRLGLGHSRDGLLHVPPITDERPLPLVVLLHGAGSSAIAGIALLSELADARGLLLLAPDSRSVTWDLIAGGGFGPDVEFLDHALEHVFARCPVDQRRVTLGGFSDGASYALSLGIGNGHLFSDLVAFSPGFAAPPARVGLPRVFVTHGVQDPVLPIDRCSRRIVPTLRAAGYDVTYEEFEGGHLVPPELARRAADWLRH
jgi:phospholipase/carboxylesterase